MTQQRLLGGKECFSSIGICQRLPMASILVKRFTQMEHSQLVDMHANPVIVVLGQKEVLGVVSHALTHATPIEKTGDTDAVEASDELLRFHRYFAAYNPTLLV